MSTGSGQCYNNQYPTFQISSYVLSQSGDSWQFLFCLRPRPEHNNRNLKLVTNIGKLDIVWRTSLCDKGRLQTSQLQRLPPNTGEIRLTFLQAPSFALINTPVPLTMR